MPCLLCMCLIHVHHMLVYLCTCTYAPPCSSYTPCLLCMAMGASTCTPTYAHVHMHCLRGRTLLSVLSLHMWSSMCTSHARVPMHICTYMYRLLGRALVTLCLLCTCAHMYAYHMHVLRVPMHMYIYAPPPWSCFSYTVPSLHGWSSIIPYASRARVHMHRYMCTASSAILFIHRAFSARVVIHMHITCTGVPMHMYIYALSPRPYSLTPCFLYTSASHARVPIHMYIGTASSAVLFLRHAFSARVVIHMHHMHAYACTCA